MKRVFYKLSLSLLRISSLLALVFWASIGPLENWNLYYPTSTEYPTNPSMALVRNPIPHLQDVYFNTADGVRLNGWFVPASNAQKSTVIYAHGNGGNIGDRTEIIRMFTKRGYGFFAFDYRGYGKSQGTPSEHGLYQDITAASVYLHNTQHIPLNKQIALGGSLGSAVVLDAATHTPFRAVIAYSTLTSAPTVAEHLRDTNRMSWLKILPLQIFMQQTFNSLSKMARVHTPLIIMHGTHDHMMPVNMPKALFTRAASSNKMLLIIPNAGHEDVIFQGENDLFDHLDKLLAETAPIPSQNLAKQ